MRRQGILAVASALNATMVTSMPEDIATQQPLDSLGRRRSPATFRDFHKGTTPANKGRSMRPEVLTAKEVSDLFAAKSGSAPGTARDRAMLSLMYRADLKIGRVNPIGRAW